MSHSNLGLISTYRTVSCESFEIVVRVRRKPCTGETTPPDSTLPPVGDRLSTPGGEPEESLSCFALRRHTFNCFVESSL